MPDTRRKDVDWKVGDSEGSVRTWEQRDAAKAEVARLRADLDALIDKSEPEPGALHYDECPYKPYAELPSWEEPENAPDCTCSMRHKATYWKSRWVVTKGYGQIAEARAAGLEAELGAWRTGAMAGATGHILRCAKVNGVWACAKGCAVARATRLAEVLEAVEKVCRLFESRHPARGVSGRRVADLVQGRYEGEQTVARLLRAALTTPDPAGGPGA